MPAESLGQRSPEASVHRITESARTEVTEHAHTLDKIKGPILPWPIVKEGNNEAEGSENAEYVVKTQKNQEDICFRKAIRNTLVTRALE